MSRENFAYLLLGAIVIYVMYNQIQKDKQEPLQSAINPEKIEPDSISRALGKLKQGAVKVNDTPEETKNAVG